MKNFKLCICFPTIVGREKQFEYIFNKIGNQVRDLYLVDEIDAIVHKDNKEISIGLKRDKMYKLSKALFTVMVDDDDDVADDYIQTVYNAICENPDVDCIGYMERCIMDGKTKYSKISNECTEWKTLPDGYERTPFFKVPIKTTLCQQVGVVDLRFGEDHDFANRLKPLLTKEYFIDKALYYYTGNSLTPEQHKERYGL
jgi:hypothetical protein